MTEAQMVAMENKSYTLGHQDGYAKGYKKGATEAFERGRLSALEEVKGLIGDLYGHKS